MASCGTCGADNVGPGQACPRCGSMSAPDLALDARPRPVKPPTTSPKHDDAPIELAVDPRSIVQERSSRAGEPPVDGQALAPTTGNASLSQPPGSLDSDARLLADYGDPPKLALLTPFYAWRVFKRRRELRAALAVRKAEAEHAQATLEDAFVALAERARPIAEKQSGYAGVIEELARAEERLRSRDEVLAAELDGQRGRLAQVDGRIGKSETELSNAQGHERAVATELTGAQGALAREDARIKRAESELKAAQQREAPAQRAGTR